MQEAQNCRPCGRRGVQSCHRTVQAASHHYQRPCPPRTRHAAAGLGETGARAAGSAPRRANFGARLQSILGCRPAPAAQVEAHIRGHRSQLSGVALEPRQPSPALAPLAGQAMIKRLDRTFSGQPDAGKLVSSRANSGRRGGLGRRHRVALCQRAVLGWHLRWATSFAAAAYFDSVPCLHDFDDCGAVRVALKLRSLRLYPPSFVSLRVIEIQTDVLSLWSAKSECV